MPDEIVTQTHTAGEPFTPTYWKLTAFTMGDIVNAGFNDRVCKLSQNSISGKYASGYAASTMLDVVPGSYVLEFDADGEGKIVFVYYLLQDDGRLKWMYHDTVNQISNGHNVMQLIIPDKMRAMLNFYGGIADTAQSYWITLTNVKIREGIL